MPETTQPEPLRFDWTGVPDWFTQTEVLPGVALERFDPSGYPFESLVEASRSMLILEMNYGRWLKEQDPSIEFRLVDPVAAEAAVDAGGAVIRYPYSKDKRYLICDGQQAAPLMRLRQVFHATTRAQAWHDAQVQRIAEQHPGASVWIDYREGGQRFAIYVDGEQFGSGSFHVPGVPRRY
ncbi:MAG: hypothetical protein AAFZ65_04900 [Planctomycetota bacterium]